MTRIDRMPTTGPARLVLEDGTSFSCRAAGAVGTTTGEVVFSTAMTGYQEVLTDPSFHGQIVTLTTAEVGVTGWVEGDDESGGIQAAGLIVKRMSRVPSSARASRSLPDALREAGVVAVEGLDTRALTRHLRVRGDMRGALSSDPQRTEDELLRLARGAAGVVGQDFSDAVSVARPQRWPENTDAAADGWAEWYDHAHHAPRTAGDKPGDCGPHIVLVDYGTKWSIARHLASRGCRVTVVPPRTPAEDVLALRPDGVLLSNGPGDPAANDIAVREVVKLLGKVPIGGICMGFQLAALACGAQTHKLPFGHRGSNHPVLVVDAHRTLVTSQNHGFAVRRESLDAAGLRLTHISLHDGTAEGFEHVELPLIAVQFHPEAGPGPHDAHDEFFGRFLSLVSSTRPTQAVPHSVRA